MLLMMAWLFWYFCVAEEKRRRDLQLNGIDEVCDEDLINNNNRDCNNENNHPYEQFVDFEGPAVANNIRQLVAEESIDASSLINQETDGLASLHLNNDQNGQSLDETSQSENKRNIVSENIDASYVNITKNRNDKSSVKYSQSQSASNSGTPNQPSDGKMKKKLVVAENIDASFANISESKKAFPHEEKDSALSGSSKFVPSDEKSQIRIIDETIDASFVKITESWNDDGFSFSGKESKQPASTFNNIPPDEKVKRKGVNEIIDASFVKLAEKGIDNGFLFDGKNAVSTHSKSNSNKGNKKSQEKLVDESINASSVVFTEKASENGFLFDGKNKTSTQSKSYPNEEKMKKKSNKSDKKSEKKLVDENINASTVIPTENENDDFSFDNIANKKLPFTESDESINSNNNKKREILAESIDASFADLTQSMEHGILFGSNNDTQSGPYSDKFISSDDKIREKFVDRNIDASFVSLTKDGNLDTRNAKPFNANDNENDNFDYEVSSAFTSVNDYDVMRASLMQNRMTSLEPYQGKANVVGSSSSTKINITTANSQNNQVAPGHIHSIVVPKDEHHYSIKVPKCDENHTHSMTLSTAEETEHSRVRSVSPSVCMHPEHPVHSTHIGYEGSSAHKENVVRSSDVNLTNSSPDGSVLFDEFKSSLSSSSKENDEKILPGKLKLKTHHKKVEELSNTPTAKLTDFDKIMRSRKLHTDTMDITATVLGNLGHRDEKIRGKRDIPVSSNWAKLQEAVSKREFLSFKDTPLSDTLND